MRTGTSLIAVVILTASVAHADFFYGFIRITNDGIPGSGIAFSTSLVDFLAPAGPPNGQGIVQNVLVMGPAWSSEGQYFVFSDVVGNTQFRVLWDDLRVTPFRKPSNNGNGNTFDFQERQISAEDFFRRVIRWELDGTMTVIADQLDGKPLNSPNDLVPHPDGRG